MLDMSGEYTQFCLIKKNLQCSWNEIWTVHGKLLLFSASFKLGCTAVHLQECFTHKNKASHLCLAWNRAAVWHIGAVQVRISHTLKTRKSPWVTVALNSALVQQQQSPWTFYKDSSKPSITAANVGKQGVNNVTTSPLAPLIHILNIVEKQCLCFDNDFLAVCLKDQWAYYWS